jgi:hypothetical protein
MLEISPILYDDYQYFSQIKNPAYSETQLQKDALLYRQYLQNMWELVIKPNNGLFVWQGQPAYSGYNDSTLSPLKLLIQKVKNENTWLTTMDDVASIGINWSKRILRLKNQKPKLLSIFLFLKELRFGE